MKFINTVSGQKISLIVLRLFIGWHFLYEGVTKLYNPSWTAKGYLNFSEGPLASIFQWLASDSMIGIIDTINVMALMFVGLTLLLGFLEREGAFIGIILLILYYLAHPAFPWLEQGIVEGNYWFVNKNLIEIGALAVIFFFPTSIYFGIKSLFSRKKLSRQST